MNRVLRILVLATLLGPPIVQITAPRDAFCEETRDCCTPDGACNATCPQCACCAGKSTSPAAVAISVDLDSSHSQPSVPPSTAPLSPPPSDILHVPKSL